MGYSSEGTGGSDFPPPHSDLSLHPPSWRTHANSDRDVLQDVSDHVHVVCLVSHVTCMFVVSHHMFQLLEHVQLTSPECVSDDSSQHLLQSMPTLCEGEESQGVEGALLKLLNQQQNSEQSYVQEVGSQPWYVWGLLLFMHVHACGNMSMHVRTCSCMFMHVAACMDTCPCMWTLPG